jgi:Anti-sigma factor NepR
MQAGTVPRPADGSAPRIDPRIQREIGKHLRAHYDDVVKEPIPDKFIELLQQLEQSVAKKS